MYGSFWGSTAAIAYYLYFQSMGLGLVRLHFERESPMGKLLIGSVAGSLSATWLPILFAFFFRFSLTSHILALLVTLPLLLLILRGRMKCDSSRRQNPGTAFSFLLRGRTKCGSPRRQNPGTVFSFLLRGHTKRGNSQCQNPGMAFSFPLRERRKDGRGKFGQDFRALLRELGEHKIFCALLLLFLSFWIYLLDTHTILPGADGELHTGQCTYGDMNMHLGFITSLARQGAFPPDYSILPGVRLSYPFLSDSISSSLYLLGASLRTAYILPMVFAMAQIFGAIYLFALTFTQTHKKSASVKAGILTLFLYLCNGGLGFVYFLGWPGEPPYRFADIFTGFYTTPTNLVSRNIRWVNIVADMFLPQRATLFGYAALFPALWLLYRAAFRDRREYFLPAGFFMAALPMIHTHSFLSAAVVSAVWLLLWLYRRVRFRINKDPKQPNQSLLQLHPSDPRPFRDPVDVGHPPRPPRPHNRPGLWIFALFLTLMCLLQAFVRQRPLPSGALMAIGLGLFAAAAAWGFTLLYCYVRIHRWEELLTGWGVWLACVLALAVPQLLFWTLGQVSEGGFVRGHFNWGNQGDFYPWFYVKNIGAPLLLILGGIRKCDRQRAPLFVPSLFLWWLGELIVFTPNTYDNNKILYVAYFLLCLGGAEYGMTLLDKRNRPTHPAGNLPSPPFARHISRCVCGLLTALFLFLCSFSGILTLSREAVSRYRLYGSANVALAEYVEENTPPDAVFLTDTRHNNEIASLTGRSIVCGADTFLYFHGLDTSQRRRDLQAMYEAPAEHRELFEKYRVSYVVVSSYERDSYAVDEDAFRREFAEVFSREDVILYRVPAPISSTR